MPSTDTTPCASIAVTMETATDITTSATPAANRSARSSPAPPKEGPNTTRTRSSAVPATSAANGTSASDTRNASRATLLASASAPSRRRRPSVASSSGASERANRPGGTARFCAAA